MLAKRIIMNELHSQNRISYQPSKDDDSNFTLDIGMKHDFSCFALWNGALERADDIVADLHREFQIIADFEVHWTKEFYRQNIARFYERPVPEGPFIDWDSKIGPTPFRFLIIRDPQPRYTWKKSVSGRIEPSNENVVKAKYRYRDFFTKKYQVHSSNNIDEFLFQAVMLLGVNRLLHALDNPSTELQILEKDLEGHDGWSSWQHLFDVLNIGARYLVLRNFEGLPKQLLDQDVDFLCDNYQRLASLCAVIQKSSQPYKGKVKVEGEGIDVNIRYVGDKYYPAAWQIDMLRRRHLDDGFFMPAPDDRFFSVLYHCKVQKLQVKSKHVPELSALATELRFDWFDCAVLSDDKECGKILAGYMGARGLYYEDPVDKAVQKNWPVIEHLPKCEPKDQKRNLVQNFGLAILHPNKAKDFAVRKLKVQVERLFMRSGG